MLCGDKEGIWAYTELIHFALQQKLMQNCKATKLQLKKNLSFTLIVLSSNLLMVKTVYFPLCFSLEYVSSSLMSLTLKYSSICDNQIKILIYLWLFYILSPYCSLLLTLEAF